MSEHTKGPWAWQKFGEEWCLTGQWGMRPIVLAVRPNRKNRKRALTSLVNGLLVDFNPLHGDARLMASAPELLSALEMVWDKVLTEYHSKDSPIRQSVEDAIAKATGKFLR